jgi:hypothetical protein
MTRGPIPWLSWKMRAWFVIAVTLLGLASALVLNWLDSPSPNTPGSQNMGVVPAIVPALALLGLLGLHALAAGGFLFSRQPSAVPRMLLWGLLPGALLGGLWFAARRLGG